jgi:hypothetical protein
VTPDEALLALDVPEDVAQRHLARLTAARATGEIGTVVPLRSRRHAVRAGTAGFVVAATLASGAGVAAASTSRPGDALYGVKTAHERLQLALARPGQSRARLELRLARTRLGEAAALLRHGHSDLAVETLARADAALASAGAHGDDAIDAEVATELDHRVEVLGGLLDGGLPDNAADAAREALTRAVDRGGRDRSGKTHGRPDDTPGNRPTPTTHPATPAHPGRDNHPTGRPTAPPGR